MPTANSAAIRSLQIIFVLFVVVRLNSAGDAKLKDCFEVLKAETLQFPFRCLLGGNPFAFDKKLGEGSFGAVFRCTGEHTGEVVKFMAIWNMRRSQSLNEAKLTKYLSKVANGTVQYRDYVRNSKYRSDPRHKKQLQGALRLGLYQDGDALSYFTTHKEELVGLSPERKQKMIKDFLDQMVEIMPNIWKNGIIVRDLKLTNFLVTRKTGGEVDELEWTVADFGLSTSKEIAENLCARFWRKRSGTKKLKTTRHLCKNIETYVFYGSHYSFIDINLMDLCYDTTISVSERLDTLTRRKLESLVADDILDILKTAMNWLNLLNGDIGGVENGLIKAFAAYELDQQRSMRTWVTSQLTYLQQFRTGRNVIAVLIEYGILSVLMAEPDLDEQRWDRIKHKLTWDGLRHALSIMDPIVAVSPSHRITPGSDTSSIGPPVFDKVMAAELSHTPVERGPKLMDSPAQFLVKAWTV